MRTKLAQHFKRYAIGLLLLAQLAWALTPAGTAIENQASAVVASGERYYSNIVQTVVRPVCVPALLPDGTPDDPGQVLPLGSGGFVTFAYILTNAGNDRFTFGLSTEVASASDWSPAEAKFYLDQNRDGAVNPGEPEVTQIALDPEEKAHLLLRVRAPAGARGNLLISAVAACPGGERDAQNYALAKAVEGPALVLKKRFSQTEVRPEEPTEVELELRNLGDAPARDEVTVQDDLTAMPGMRYVPGSARAPKGQIEYWDGQAWTSSEPEAVKAIRLRLPGLAVGEVATLRFALNAEPGRRPGDLENVAEAEGPGGPAEARAVLHVLPSYRHYLGPKGNPRALPGGEGSENDRQSAFLIGDRWSCFEHTLENAGNTDDTYTLTYDGLPSGLLAQLEWPDGSPLGGTVALGAGEQVDFRICLRSSDGQGSGDGFTLELIATSAATGDKNRTWDRVLKVLSAEDLGLEKRVNPTGAVVAGGLLTYTLQVQNDTGHDLTNVRIVDPLSRYVEYVSSEPEGNYDADTHTLSWRLGRLERGQSWSAKVKVRVRRDAPDDVRVENAFRLESDQMTDALGSKTVVSPVWSSQILLKKDVSPRRVRIGDRVTYTLTLSNPSKVRVKLNLVDEPDPHLRYIPGTAKPFEPSVEGGRLLWSGIELAPGEQKTFTYRMRVLPGVPQKPTNRVRAQGETQGGTALATGWVHARLLVMRSAFQHPKGTLVGRVFLDTDRDGLFDEDRDVPLPGARVVLSDGRQAVTDAEGRYAFRDLEPGVWLVRLDEGSAPFEPLPHPAAMGDGYSHRVRVMGLSVSDFPLIAPRGWIRGVRATRLRMGPLEVEKHLVPLGEDRYRVVLHLVARAPLPDFELRDPLPGGGFKRFRFEVLEGERTITYDLPAPAWLTDPEVRWRYP